MIMSLLDVYYQYIRCGEKELISRVRVAWMELQRLKTLALTLNTDSLIGVTEEISHLQTI